MSSLPPIRRALLSVSNKTNLINFANILHNLGVTLLSTGGTAKLLQEHNIPATEVSEYTGFPEMMAGRVKTLHPKIHGGLLGRRGIDDTVMQQHNIEPIDLLVVNLYPFEQTIANPACSLSEAIENIDIGGPAMLRSAAKNYAAVTVVVDPDDYAIVLKEMQQFKNAVSEATRQRLAQKVFAHTARYDAAIANYLSHLHTDFPDIHTLQSYKKRDLRYGENPHQRAAFYVESKDTTGSIAAATQLQGKELSFNNIVDADAALECVKSFDTAACVIVKHANPCGVALANDLLTAYQRAYQTDPTSAFGGIIAFNQKVDAGTMTAILEQQFVEVIVAPEFADDALQVASKKTNVRLLSVGYWSKSPDAGFDLKRVRGGLLIQDYDTGIIEKSTPHIVTRRKPTTTEMDDLLFAWKVAKFVKSNAIVYAKDKRTIGIGAGQMSRVYSAKIAGIKAADENLAIEGSVMASDAFFPFRDGIDAAAKMGIAAIIQPGGSMRDAEVIAAADELGLAMVFTGMRHFRH